MDRQKIKVFADELCALLAKHNIEMACTQDEGIVIGPFICPSTAILQIEIELSDKPGDKVAWLSHHVQRYPEDCKPGGVHGHYVSSDAVQVQMMEWG